MLSTELIVFTILGGLLPAIFWLWFWLKEDREHPEPLPLIVAAFLVGCLAVIPAYFGEQFVRDYFGLSLENGRFALITLWAAIEEVVKFVAVFAITFRSRFFDEPVDAMVYMITGALGFAAVENTLFMFRALYENSGELLGFILTGNFRFVGATVVHIVASATVGALVGLAFYRQKPSKVLHIIWGLLIATVLHAIFNYFIIIGEGGDILKIFLLLWTSAVCVIYLFERIKNVTYA